MTVWSATTFKLTSLHFGATEKEQRQHIVTHLTEHAGIVVAVQTPQAFRASALRALARVDKITHRALLFNLLILFWVTLLPFAAENAADRPLEPLGPSLLAFSCGAFFLSYLGFRFSVHSTIDDVAAMRRWRKVRVRIAFAMVGGNFLCAILAWFSPWFGYAGAMATVLLFLVLRSPPESEEKFIREAGVGK